MTHYMSLSDQNQFSFTCPTFNAKIRMGSCTMLRDLVWRGRGPEKRKGCQAAMTCGLCPAATMVSLYCFNNSWKNDHHGSATPVDGKLHSQVLAKIAYNVPVDSMIRHYELSPAEETLLYSAGERIREQLKTAPGDFKHREDSADHGSATKKRRVKAAAPAKDTTVNNAAATGDLAAAINQ